MKLPKRRAGSWLAMPHSIALTGLIMLAGAVPDACRAGPPRLTDRQHMLLVDGQPRLILGLYENPKDDAVLEAAIRAGFNLIQCGAEPAALDRVQRFGAKAWVNVGGALDLSTDAANRRRQLAETVQRVGRHPALLLWEGPDEVLWNNWWLGNSQMDTELQTMRAKAKGRDDLETLSRRVHDCYERGRYVEFEQARAEFWRLAGQPSPNPGLRIDDAPARAQKCGAGITAGIRALHELDPGHVVWLNHAPRNSLQDLRLFNRAVDMAGCDIYPAPANVMVGHSDLIDLTLGSVGAYTERMRQAAPGKACAMVLQGFGWRDLREKANEKEDAVGAGRRPTWKESRFMAYDAILHGANAVLYWGTAYLKPVEDDGATPPGRPRLWQDLLRVARELRALEPALVTAPQKSPVVRLAPTYGSIDGSGILCAVHKVDSDFVVLVLNETGDGLGYTLEGLPEKLNGKKLFRLYSAEEHSITHRSLADGIRARDVQVFATSRRFEDPLVAP